MDTFVLVDKMTAVMAADHFKLSWMWHGAVDENGVLAIEMVEDYDLREDDRMHFDFFLREDLLEKLFSKGDI